MTINLTEIYDVTVKKETRDAAKGGFVRPTLAESFMTHKDFVEVIARAVPGAPTIGTVTLDNGSAVIPFTAPGNNGNSPIISYTATSTPGNLTGTVNQAGSGSITISGLTVGISYTFKIIATNVMGTSAESEISNPVFPTSAPGIPTIGTAVRGNAQATVPFTAPASNGGSVITSYTATSTPGSFTGTLSQAGSGTITVTGLSNGTSYTFKVKATNAVGVGAESAASNVVVPSTVPGAPTIGTATINVTTASVPFTAPASNGGSTITSYTATSTPGNITGTLTQAGSGSITVSGLTANTSYTFKVKAINAVGTGAESSASNSITTATVPGTPTIGTATVTGTTASVPFTAPASNGGATITSYTATSTPTGLTGTLNQSGSGSITVTGLTIGTSYTFKVKATNIIGTGADSTASNAIVPDPEIMNLSSYTHTQSDTAQGPGSLMSTQPAGARGWGTPWTPTGVQQWVQVDMGMAIKIVKFGLHPWLGYSYGVFPKNFYLQGSNSATTGFVTLLSPTTLAASTNTWQHWNLSATYRYWRLVLMDSWGYVSGGQYWAEPGTWQFSR